MGNPTKEGSAGCWDDYAIVGTLRVGDSRRLSGSHLLA